MEKNKQGREVEDVYVARWVAILDRVDRESLKKVTFEQRLTVSKLCRLGSRGKGRHSTYSRL